jgi:hypothetical protein
MKYTIDKVEIDSKEAKMNDTIDSTFSLFFADDDEPTQRVCCECGSTEDLSVLYTTESGKQVYECAALRALRESTAHEHQTRESERILRWAELDEWEE